MARWRQSLPSDTFRRMLHTPLSLDTTADAETRQLAAWRALGTAGRLRCAQELSLAVRRLEILGLISRHPSLDAAARARLLARRHLGERLGGLLYGTGDGGE